MENNSSQQNGKKRKLYPGTSLETNSMVREQLLPQTAFSSAEDTDDSDIHLHASTSDDTGSSSPKIRTTTAPEKILQRIDEMSEENRIYRAKVLEFLEKKEKRAQDKEKWAQKREEMLKKQIVLLETLVDKLHTL